MEKIIVYRNQSEAMMDEFLYGNPELVAQIVGWGIAVVVAVISVNWFFNRYNVSWYIRNKCGRFNKAVYNVCLFTSGGATTCLTFYGLKMAMRFALTL